MKFYDSVIIVSLLLVVQMLLTVCTNNVLSYNNKITLFMIYLMAGVAALCEWVSHSLNGALEYAAIIKVVVTAKFLITSIFPVIYANMILDNLKDIEGLKRNKQIVYIILGFHIVFELISFKYGWTFYIDEYGYRQYGKLYWLYILICISSIMYFFRVLFLFNQYFQNKNIITLLGVLVLGTTGTVIQYIHPELKVKWLSIISASILVYMCYNETAMYVDDLTELLNKGVYQKKLKNIKKEVTILMFDVDSFKEINTEYGHDFGDKVLRFIGKCIKNNYGPYGTCYRYGGDEFFVILEKQHNDYKKLNSRFVLKLEEARLEEERKSGRKIPYISIGCTKFDPKVQDVFEAVEIADKDMYYWKEELKNRRRKESMKK